MAETQTHRYYAHGVLFQMLVVFTLLGMVILWQWDVLHQIYLRNQINAVGWTVNGGIALLFFCGLGALVWRFFEYRREEYNLTRFAHNLRRNQDPLHKVRTDSMIAARYRTLQGLRRRRAVINHSALAATLLATESSRNSFVKFVHNVLILTGVFGTIISLSLSLLGASDLIHGNVPASGQASGFGAMIFGMSTALSTTMTAILAYLIFGYFYIKLTDTQTYLISRVEEITATTLLPMLQPGSEAVVRDYSDSVRSAGQLIKRFDQSQQRYDAAVESLHAAAKTLSQRVEGGSPGDVSREELASMLSAIGEQQQQNAAQNRELLAKVINLLQEGFRLGK